MTSGVELSRFQIDVAQLFFSLPASNGYAIAGGAGLIATELINRPTHDLDLFAHAPIRTVTRASGQFLTAAAAKGWTAIALVDTPTFYRVHVIGPDDEVLVDLAIDSPPTYAPALTILGPTLMPLDLAGRKLLALFCRAEARDFADVFILVQRFDKEALLHQAARTDSGFDPLILAEMFATLERFADDEIPMSSELVPEVRAFFAAWSEELHHSR